MAHTTPSNGYPGLKRQPKVHRWSVCPFCGWPCTRLRLLALCAHCGAVRAVQLGKGCVWSHNGHSGYVVPLGPLALLAGRATDTTRNRQGKRRPLDTTAQLHKMLHEVDALRSAPATPAEAPAPATPSTDGTAGHTRNTEGGDR